MRLKMFLIETRPMTVTKQLHRRFEYEFLYKSK